MWLVAKVLDGVVLESSALEFSMLEYLWKMSELSDYCDVVNS